MSLVGDVKCGRCDKHYSALRGRCPYCGARRGSAGKHSGDRDDIKGKAIVGIIFLVIILIAVSVLLVTSLKAAKDNEPPAVTTPNLPDEGDINEIENPDEPPVPTPEPTPTPTPPPVLSSYIVTYGGYELAKDTATGNYDFSARVGETLTIRVKLQPDGVEDVEATWEISDTTIADGVVAIDGLSMQVTILSAANTKLTVTLDGITRVVTIRGRR